MSITQTISIAATGIAVAGAAAGVGQKIQIPLWVAILLIVASPKDIWDFVRKRGGLDKE